MSETDSGKVKAPLDQYAQVEPAPLPPIGHDGAPILGAIGLPPPVPAATPRNFVCLRGPCRFYWELHTFMGSGNPAATWGEDGLKDEDGNRIREPRQINRVCLVHPGTETELTEDCVFHCTKWDPLLPRETKRLERRRSKYLRLHPDHAPPPEPDLTDDEIEDMLEHEADTDDTDHQKE